MSTPPDATNGPKLPVTAKQLRNAVYSDIEWVSQKPLNYSDPDKTEKRKLGGVDLGMTQKLIDGLLRAHLNLTIRSLKGKDSIPKGALTEGKTVGDALKETRKRCPKTSVVD